MKNSLLFLLFTGVLFTQISVGQNVYEWYMDGELYIKYKTKTSMFSILDKPVEPKLSVEQFASLAVFKDKYQITAVSAPFHGLSPTLSSTVLVKFGDIHNVEALIAALSKDPEIEYVEKVPLDKIPEPIDFKIIEKQETGPEDRLALTPNDGRYSKQWALKNLEAAKAWDLSVGNKNIVVAAVDAFVEHTHEDIKPIRWVNPNETPENGIDDDNNGYVDDYYGWDAVNEDGDPNHSGRGHHGTHVAGDIGAATNNGLGIASIGFGVTVMGVNISSNGSDIPASYEGVTYAIRSGYVDVINMSWVSTSSSQTRQNLMTEAYNKGIVCIAAAGNDGNSTPKYPAAYDHVLAIGGTTSTNDKASFSSHGSWVDVAAPAVEILSTYLNSQYASFSGTSFAAPIASGLAGLILSVNPDMTVDQVFDCMVSTADPITATNIGSGRINALKALQCAMSTMSAAPVAEFTSNTTATCSGNVQFYDQSSYAPNSWFWDFGDGNTSTERDPLHTYSAPGTYNVTLKVTNPNGEDEIVKSSYIEVKGLGVGNNPIQNAGPADTAMNGGAFFTANDAKRIFFDAHVPFLLKSVKVYAASTGMRTIEVLDGAGNLVASKEANIPTGESRVQLDFEIPEGTNYAIKVKVPDPAQLNMYRNSNVTGYPFTLDGIVTITKSDASAGNETRYYYYFYDWEVQKYDCTGISTGINEKLTDINIFPNPGTGIFNIEFANAPEKTEIRVIDIHGKEIYRLNTTDPPLVKVNLSNHPDGVYLIEMKQGTARSHTKIVLQHR